MTIQLKCPKCARILGDTDKSCDIVLNCPNCKRVRVKTTIAESVDYLIRKEHK